MIRLSVDAIAKASGAVYRYLEAQPERQAAWAEVLSVVARDFDRNEFLIAAALGWLVRDGQLKFLTVGEGWSPWVRLIESDVFV